MKRILSMILALSLLLGLVPGRALATVPRAGEIKPTAVTTAAGESLPVEESWETAYPYGAFLFSDSETYVTEGGPAQTLRLYRMGGTAGRATATVLYAPVVVYLDENTPATGSAAGAEDLLIEVEDPLPIAQYQPVGKDPDPEPSQARVLEAPAAQPGDRLLTLDAAADAWQWYVLAQGRWEPVEDATDQEFVAEEDLLSAMDVRCEYTQNGTRYCSVSLRGAAYEKPAPEVLPAQPDDLDLAPEQTFTPLAADPEDPYQTRAFPVTFAGGEWVKEIRVTAPENTVAQPLRFGTFTLVEHEGGAIFSQANTLTLGVRDNDAPAPYTLGFVQSTVRADKADGTAQVTLKRVGGGQSMISVDYATRDGTALAGRDYQAATGTAVFYADVDEVTLNVPLFSDGTVSEEAKTFSVVLGELKGDPDGLCTLTGREAVVEVVSTGAVARSGEDAPAVVLQGAPLATVDSAPVTGEQVLPGEEDLLTAAIAGYDDPEPDDDTARLMTYNYGEITFPGTHGGSYWGDRATIAGQPLNDLTAWSAGNASGNGWQLSSTDSARAMLFVEDMAQRYTGIYANFQFSAGLDNGWHWTNGWAYGWAAVNRRSTAARWSASSNPQFSTSNWGFTRHLSWTTGGTINESWGVDADLGSVSLEISKHNNESDDPVYSRITTGWLNRRTFTRNLNLRIHTANDGESGGGNVVTAPSGAAALKEGSGVYASMKPLVTIGPDQGGVNSSGRLYVGSKVTVTLRRTDSYKPYSGSQLSSAVYVTRADGSIAPARVQSAGKGESYYVTLVWDNMTEADLRDAYTINVVMTRTQEVELNLRPSVARKVNPDGSRSSDIDPEKIGQAWETFWDRASDSSKNYITVGVSETTAAAPHFSTTVREKKIYPSDWKAGDKNPLKSLGSFDNIQYINFNRTFQDKIVAYGRSYSGNETIWLTVEDLAFASRSFQYYSAEYLTAPNIMSVAIDRVELYLDGDGDGRIAGRYNPDTGYFTLDSGTADTFEQYLDRGGSYDEVMFQPVKLADGRYAQYVAKLFYTMTPRYLVTPPGAFGDGVAQVLPALTTSVTDSDRLAQLTEEQRSYRYVLSGRNPDGSGRTSDGHPMSGQEATATQFVDVPLGGDRSPLEQLSADQYRWEPDFVGNLLYPYSDPQPLFIQHSLMGENYPLAEFSYDAAGQKVVTTPQGKANLNGYLGSLVADTTIALCVTEQHHTADELARDKTTAATLRPESSTLSQRTAAPNSAYLSQIDQGSSGMGAAGFDTKDSGQKYGEFNLDYNMDLPITNESFPGLVTVVTGKNTVNLVISLPIAGFKKNNGSAAKGSVFPETVTKPTEIARDQITGWTRDLQEPGGYDNLREALKRGGYESPNGGSLKSRNVSGSVSFSAVFTLKYDTTANEYYLQEFAFGAAGSVSFKYTARLAACPLVYLFTSVSAGVTVTTGGSFLRTAVEGEIPFIDEKSPRTLQQGDSLVFSTAFANMNVQFSGRIYVETLDSPAAAKPLEGSNRGVLSSDGGKKIQLQLMKVKGSTSFDPQKSTKYIRIVALETTTVTYLNTIESIHSELTWSGVRIAPNISAEFGGGAGVEGLKVEVFLKLAVSANFVFGQPQPDGTRKGATVASASFGLSLALRAVLLMATWQIDAVGVSAKYDGAQDKWTTSYTVLGREHEIKASLAADGGEDLLQLPENLSDSQTIYSGQPTDGDTASLMAYDADDPNVPFQLSGYNSSTQAFRLVDGLDIGYDYKIVTANGANYVLYTVARPGGTGMDTSMLVLSRLVLTGDGYGQNVPADQREESAAADPSREPDAGTQAGLGLGLVNPLDWEEITDEDGTVRQVLKDPAHRSETPYILVDNNYMRQDDGTGDLEFDVKVIGNDICVAWVSYLYPLPVEESSSPRELFQRAARSRVIKRAAYDVTMPYGFSYPQTVSNAHGGVNVFQPVVLTADTVAFAQGELLSPERRQTLVDAYIQKLNALGYYADQGDEASRSIFQYRLTTYENDLDSKGEVNHIGLGVGRTYKIFESTAPIDKLAGMELGGDFYLAYSTWQETADPERDHTTSLCMAHLTPEGDPTLAHSYQLQPRTLYGSAQEKTASYTGLQFVETTLNEKTGPEKVFLFEKDNVINLIDQYNLTVLFSGGWQGSVTVTPFFAGDAETIRDRRDIAVGTDGAGGLAAVYVANVANTTNTGLFLSPFDPRTRSWGAGTLLAMRHMDVYEDAARYGWSDETAEQAFLGELEDYDGGGLEQFQFANPQIALGVQRDETAGSGTDQTHSRTTLVILTQGMMRYLSSEVSEDGQRFFLPGADQPAGSPFPPGMGVYAISYGVGNQSIGRANLSFVTEEFTAGSALTASLSFLNTGDVSIRGSRENPITVVLSAHGEGVPETKLARWAVTENIAAGREVTLTGEFTLPMTLPEGAAFSLTVSEDETYAADPYSATLGDVYTVEARPELAFESATVALARRDNGTLTLDENGDVVLDVDLFVGNRGTRDAENVFLQFTHGVYDPAVAQELRAAVGEETSWNDVLWSALSIAKNDLTVGEEEQLATLQADAPGHDFSRGILALGGLRAGYGRHVRGTVTVPAEVFTVFAQEWRQGLAGSLRLAVEIFSDADSDQTPDALRVTQAERGEYNVRNNRYEVTLEHATAFTVPTQLEVPVGTRLRLPVSFSTTLGDARPEITAVELADCEDLDNNPATRRQSTDQTLDTIRYEAGDYSSGRGFGTVVLRGGKEGNAYVRLQDARTNAYQDVAILFTAPGEGLDVTQLSGFFSFFDQHGAPYRDTGANRSWQFLGSVGAWGKDRSEPYRRTLAKGLPGASFTFTTEAETLALWLDGEATVASDFPGFQPVTLRGEGSRAQVTFGANPTNRPHRVTVTVTRAGSDGTAAFDRIQEYYCGDKVDLTQWQAERPMSLVWGTPLPEKGSLKPGQTFEATLYVVNNCPMVDGRLSMSVHLSSNVSEVSWIRSSWRHYEWRLRFSGNGDTTIRLQDQSGQSAALQMNVDWWQTGDVSALWLGESPAMPFYCAVFPESAVLREQAMTYFSGWQTSLEEHDWMQTAWDPRGKAIVVTIDPDAPAQQFLVQAEETEEAVADTVRLQGDSDGTVSVARGASVQLPVSREGLYRVTATAARSEGADSAYDFFIRRADGSVEDYNAQDSAFWNTEYVSVSLMEDCPRDDACPMGVFRDLWPAAWYHDGVHWALEQEIMNGKGQGVFAPKAVTTRAQLVTMLYRMEGQPAAAAPAFTDVPAGKYYTAAVGWAAENGLVEGYGDGTFGPNNPLTREQLATILCRYARYQGHDTSAGEAAYILDYTDAGQISQWGERAFRWAVYTGIINGTGDLKLSPRTGAQRAQVATMLRRYAWAFLE